VPRTAPLQELRPLTTRKVSFLPTSLLVLVGALAGCGASKATDVFAIKNGMTKQQVQKLAGSPYRLGRNCWLYHASKEGTTIDGMRFCFTNGHVSLIQTSAHL
jgi:hypothetical protein